jgi:hypothetical protein
MSAAAPATRRLETTSSVRFVDQVIGLAGIFEPQVNIVVLRRPRSAALAAECGRAVAQTASRRLFSVTTDASMEHAIAAEFDGFPELAADVQFWVEALAELTGNEHIGVRLARLEAAMCPRLHVDRVALRLVCTYHGPGTEFVPSERFDRTLLGHALHNGHAGNHVACEHEGGVLAAQAGDIVLLKGETWPDNAGRGAIHRSASASAQTPRLVMTLDPL